MDNIVRIRESLMNPETVFCLQHKKSGKSLEFGDATSNSTFSIKAKSQSQLNSKVPFRKKQNYLKTELPHTADLCVLLTSSFLIFGQIALLSHFMALHFQQESSYPKRDALRCILPWVVFTNLPANFKSKLDVATSLLLKS